jgi:aminoglycoside phosphotransferase (APT) family kinase protein
MTMTRKPHLPIARIADWLAERYDAPVTELAPISGGFWSAAYTYRVGDDEFVFRLSNESDGFVIDRAAMQFAAPDLPIPEVTEMGEVLGHHYAISRRHSGRFLEDVALEEADAAGGALERLLAALRAVPSTSDTAVVWHEPKATAGLTWREWLRAGVTDNPDSLVSGWRKALAGHRRIDAIFRACESRIEALLPYCPERRDLVHGDLLHQNVLVSEDATRVTAIFSWKCSVRGDFLFDVAWCTFWGPWHPGIEAAGLWQRTLDAPDLSERDLADAPLRHYCYELQIAASHFGWNVWADNAQELAAVAARAEALLQRGPLPMPLNKG